MSKCYIPFIARAIWIYAFSLASLPCPQSSPLLLFQLRTLSDLIMTGIAQASSEVTARSKAAPHIRASECQPQARDRIYDKTRGGKEREKTTTRSEHSESSSSYNVLWRRISRRRLWRRRLWATAAALVRRETWVSSCHLHAVHGQVGPRSSQQGGSYPPQQQYQQSGYPPQGGFAALTTLELAFSSCDAQLEDSTIS